MWGVGKPPVVGYFNYEPDSSYRVLLANQLARHCFVNDIPMRQWFVEFSECFIKTSYSKFSDFCGGLSLRSYKLRFLRKGNIILRSSDMSIL